MPFLEFQHVSKVYHNSTKALDDLRTCLHKKYVWIFEHNFVADKAKYAGGLSVAIHPSATLLCSRAESCLERSRPASIFHAVCSKICRKDTCIRL